MPADYPAHTYAAHHADRFRAELIDLLRIPSVSTLPAHAPDVQRAADWIVADLQRSGMTIAASHQAPGCLPLVYGEWTGVGPAAPTVLVYTHFDVQPAELDDGWDTDPFTPTEKDGRLYARGAVDSKSHVVAWLKAIEALLNADARCPVNLKVLFEGEEESDSGHIFRHVAENPDRLAADVIIISDGSMPREDQPVLCYGLRGIISTELVVEGPIRDLHSGAYGGTVHNPIQALTEILAALHDSTGRVTVPGFYDAVRAIDDDERAALAASAPLLAEVWESGAAAPARWGEPGYALHERIGARPTLEINGIAGGFAGPGFKTVIPARALAKISCRLVPDQDPAAIFDALQAHITALTPPGVTSTLRSLEQGAGGILLDRTSAAMQAAARAYERGWGASPIFTRAGGSVPVVEAFQRHLAGELVMLPFGLKAGGAHGPNEFVVWEMFHKGIATAIHFVHELAAQR
jgi:acetylornithine deacetylase/succinyl-diaminopimelate desuccinylase-like protein